MSSLKPSKAESSTLKQLNTNPFPLKSSRVELLLPAGNWDSLTAAVENGADAVYLGTNQFNARIRADNFSLDKFKEVTDYCHSHGVRVYCTMNILVKNTELKDYFETIHKLYQANVDAVIIQELSFLPIIKSNFPDLEVHISTQAAIANSHFQPLLDSADRVILPREFSLEQIQEFIHRTDIPIEVFVQGALCFSYSGKCLFSSLLGGRSGNRGMCAQPCRRKYNGRYLLSMKDLCLIHQLPKLINSGVSTLKIEGRLRSPRYVAAAAKAYRSAIDSYYGGKFIVSEELLKNMKLAFNREFTEGYFSKRNDVISPEQPMGRGLFLGTILKGNLIDLQEDLVVGDGLGIWLQDKVDGAILRKMEKDGKSINSAKKGELVKLFIRAPPGTRIYKTSSATIPSLTNSSSTLTASSSLTISNLRKSKLIIIKRKKVNLVLPSIITPKDKSEIQDTLLVKVYSVKDAQTALANGADKVFYNIFAPDFNPHLSAYIPRILSDQEVDTAVKKVLQLDVKDVLTGDLGAYLLLKNKVHIYLDYSVNIFNDYDLNFFQRAVPIISPELCYDELKEFQNKNFAVLVHGRLVLMNTLYLSLPSRLRDEKNFSFPVRKEHNYYQILNSLELGLFEEILKLKEIGIRNFFLDLESNISKNSVGSTVKLYHDLLAGKKVNVDKHGFTKGHWLRGVQ